MFYKGAILTTVIGILVILWVLAKSKKSRGDGRFIKKVHQYRQLLNYITPTRAASVVYFDEYVEADNLLNFVEIAKEKYDANMTHCLLYACKRSLEDTPSMNFFASGKRLYERNGIHFSFSMKRKKLNKKSKISAVKMKMKKDETFKQLCERVNGKINVERSGKKTYSDKEFDLLTLIPRFLLEPLVNFLNWLDHCNLLPFEFIKGDPMFSSMFIANLGSLGMNAGFHHLYEYGNCSIFVMVGKVNEMPIVKDGKVVVKKMLHIRFSYDERIDDGLTSKSGIKTISDHLADPFNMIDSSLKQFEQTGLVGNTGRTNKRSEEVIN
jgi:hypothetical protein